MGAGAAEAAAELRMPLGLIWEVAGAEIVPKPIFKLVCFHFQAVTVDDEAVREFSMQSTREHITDSRDTAVETGATSKI